MVYVFLEFKHFITIFTLSIYMSTKIKINKKVKLLEQLVKPIWISTNYHYSCKVSENTEIGIKNLKQQTNQWLNQKEQLKQARDYKTIEEFFLFYPAWRLQDVLTLLLN